MFRTTSAVAKICSMSNFFHFLSYGSGNALQPTPPPESETRETLGASWHFEHGRMRAYRPAVYLTGHTTDGNGRRVEAKCHMTLGPLALGESQDENKIDTNINSLSSDVSEIESREDSGHVAWREPDIPS